MYTLQNRRRSIRGSSIRGTNVTNAVDITSPPPRGYLRLLSMSRAVRWQDAQREWTPSGAVMDETDRNYPAACELCGHYPVRQLFELTNVVTGAVLWIGSECVVRFRLAEPYGTAEDNRVRLSRVQAEHEDRKALAEAGAILKRGRADALRAAHNRAVLIRFYRALRRRYHVDTTSSMTAEQWGDLVRTVFGTAPQECTREQLDALRSILRSAVKNAQNQTRAADAVKAARPTRAIAGSE